MNIQDCIEYTKKEIQRDEVLSVINTYPLTDYVRTNEELYEDILWLLNNKELTYILPYKQKDYRTPNMIEAFTQFGIKITGKESFVKFRDKKLYIKVRLDIEP
jgi:hypothetical protein